MVCDGYADFASLANVFASLLTLLTAVFTELRSWILIVILPRLRTEVLSWLAAVQ